MAMVVRSNLMAYNANRQLGMNNSAVSKNLEKLSSGFKINRAADDAAGLSISEKMKAQIKNLEQSSLNAQDGISLIQTAEGALTETHDMLNRMMELVTKASNGTIDGDTDRKAIQDEITALNDEITRIAATTKFNDIELLGGGAAGALKLNIQVGDSDPANTIAIDLSTLADSAGVMNATGLGTDAITDIVGDPDGTASQAHLTVVKDAIQRVSDARGTLGALQNRLEHTINNLDVTAENMTNANSRIRDTDMAKQMMEYTKMNVLTQSAQAMLAQANQQPQSILQLLQ